MSRVEFLTIVEPSAMSRVEFLTILISVRPRTRRSRAPTRGNTTRPPPATWARHPPPETLRCFLIDSAIGASNLHPPTDARPSRSYLHVVGQFPNLSIKGRVNNF